MTNHAAEKVTSYPITVHNETSSTAQISEENAEQVNEVPKGGLTPHVEVEKTPAEAKAERRFVRKIDFIILPLLASMYFLASLDRGDIGNAAVAGMTEDLKLTPQMLSNAASMFYVGYIVFQLPGDLFLRVVTPPVQLALALILWGTFTTVISAAKSYSALVGLRVGVGVGEAFLQAGPLYLTFWYKRNEIATRIAIFFSTSAIAGAFNGVIAYGIQKNIAGARGLAAWQWIFLIEGVISIGYGFVVLFLLPPVPEKIKWGFTKAEKEIAVRRSQEAFNVIDSKINPRQLLDLLKDPKAWFYVVMYSCVQVSLASFSTFLPVILRTFDFSTPLDTQALTIPIYVCAAISNIVLGVLSDKLQRRGLFLMISFTIAGAGWLILLVSHNHRLSYAAMFLIGIGTYPTVVCTQAWSNSNIIGFTKRAGILAMVNMVGQCFSIAATQVYSDAPKYYRGNGFALGACFIGFVTALVLQIYLRRKNAQKRDNQHTEEAALKRQQDINHIGDDHPDFIYYL